MNNDGYNDIVCDYDASTGNQYNGIYLFHGGEILDSIPDWNYQNYSYIASSVVKDVNQDGYDDIAFSKAAGMNLRQAFLFYGGENISSEPDLTFPSGWEGPYHVYSTGDVNADGYNDIIMDASSSSVCVYYGGDPMDTESDITFYLPDAGHECGFAGDVNGDDIHDFMFYADTEEEFWKGQVFIYGDPDLTPHVEPRYGGEFPSSFTLNQNVPNPFNGSTVIAFQCQKAGWMDLNIYNILGQKVYSLSHNASAGERVRVLWDGTDMNGISLPSGVYLVELSDGWDRQTMKMGIVR